MNNLGKAENRENKGSSVKGLVGFMITTCFSRLAQSNDMRKIELYREKIKEMLDMEQRQHRGEEERYSYLKDTVDSFFDYVESDEVLADIRAGKLGKPDLQDRFLEDIMNIPKRKYDMRDLYKQELISSSRNNPELKNVRVLLRNDGIEHAFTDEHGKSVLLTDVGTIAYEEWGGVRADLSLYQLQKERPNGVFTHDIICTRVIIPEMENQDYRNAVLKELFSDENIKYSNANSYIGQISRMPKHDKSDLPRTEKQDSFRYIYRIDDNYVLEYDATELTAVVEAVRQYSRENRGKTDSVIGKYNIGIEQNETRKGHSEAEGYDEPDGR